MQCSLTLLLTAVRTGIPSVEGTLAIYIKVLNARSLRPAISFLGIYPVCVCVCLCVCNHTYQKDCVLFLEATFVNSKNINKYTGNNLMATHGGGAK